MKPRENIQSDSMRDKYANKTPLKRFLHKYTGLIICGVILAVGIPIVYSMMSDQFFFETWNCGTVYHYLFSGKEFTDIANHDELTGPEHVRLHEIYEECRQSNPPTQKEFFTHEMTIP